MEWKFKDDDKVSFNTTDSTFCAMNGCLCTIVRKLTEKEADLFETRPMYVIEFPDGSEAQAFEDELDDSQRGMPVNK